ncbi:cytochrome c oxidase assembly protein [Dictyobacter aurantiacus]|uniref:Thioredoxin domain-containing protein n=1 Tax=Dictyobacter aurantiacus TaxID=1936993 RepID=A0A401ZIS7_9CHLR|nr:cytochrome c oxidase assembly protein [Dictyobacter aurantiacus]GCE06734.1 hypothetical protein KDAU_40630 [Dictyobacter aurantiacus]
MLWFGNDGWPVPPVVLLICLGGEVLYLRGWLVVARREEARGYGWLWRGFCFVGALLAFLLAASGFIDELSERLFWVHMVQHLLLLMVMAPLLVAAAPLLAMWWGLPRRARTWLGALFSGRCGRFCARLGHWLRRPTASCGLLLVGIWIWHWPPLYDLALSKDLIHDWGEHLSFNAVSFVFWSQVIPSPPLRVRASSLGQLGCIGFAIAQNLVLAVLLGFAPHPIYGAYAHRVAWPGALSPLQDQQFGAGIMWTFGDVPFGLAFSFLLQRWLLLHTSDTLPIRSDLAPHTFGPRVRLPLSTHDHAPPHGSDLASDYDHILARRRGPIGGAGATGVREAGASPAPMIMAVVCVVVMVVGLLWGGRTLLAAPPSATSTAIGGFPMDGKSAPDFTLLNQFNRSVTLSALRGHEVVLAFIDARCTTLCPLTAEIMYNAKARLKPQEAGKVVLLAVNANPNVTSVTEVQAWSNRHGMLHRWQFLTGNSRQLQAIYHQYNVYDQVGADAEVAHDPTIFIIDAGGRSRLYYETLSSSLTADLRSEEDGLLAGMRRWLPGIRGQAGASPAHTGGLAL